MTELTPKLNPRRWNLAFKRLWTLHWVMAACFLIIYPLGIVMSNLPRDVSFRGSMYHIHKSFGVLAIFLLLYRVLTLLQVYKGKYLKRSPKFTRQWTQNVIVHGLLYGMMLIVPITGVTLSASGGHNIPLFFFNLPIENVPKSWYKISDSLHFWLGYVSLALIILHILLQKNYLRRKLKQWIRKFT